MVDETTQRAERLCALMNERIRTLSPPERDRRLQQFLAEAMTPSQKLRALCGMMNFVIACNRIRHGGRHD